MYESITTKKRAHGAKKDRSVRPAILAVLIFGIAVVILVSIPLQRHRQFMRFVSDLSSMTSRAGVKETVEYCEDEEVFRISTEAAYEVYSKLVFAEYGKRIDPDETLAAEGFTLTYGLLGGHITIAPIVFQDEAAVYVDYHSRDIDYTYIAPHLDYDDICLTVRNGRLP